MSIFESKIRECDIPQEDFVSIPVHYFEDLIRAETERDILEAVICGEHKYTVEEVMQAIKKARENRDKRGCGVLSVELGVYPFSDEDPDSDEKGAADTNAAAGDMEDPADDEACE